MERVKKGGAKNSGGARDTCIHKRPYLHVARVAHDDCEFDHKDDRDDRDDQNGKDDKDGKDDEGGVVRRIVMQERSKGVREGRSTLYQGQVCTYRETARG